MGFPEALRAVAEEEAWDSRWTLSGGGGQVIRLKHIGVIDAGEGDGGAGVEDKRLVLKKAQAFWLEDRGKGDAVMITEDAEGATGCGEDLCEEAVEPLQLVIGRWAAVFEEITGDDGEVKVDVLERAEKFREQAGVQIEVQVGEMQDGEPVHLGGPVADPVGDAACFEGEVVAVAEPVESAGAEREPKEGIAPAGSWQACGILLGLLARLDPRPIPALGKVHVHTTRRVGGWQLEGKARMPWGPCPQ